MPTLRSGAHVGIAASTSQVMSPRRAGAATEGSNATLDSVAALVEQLDTGGLPLADRATQGSDRMLLEAIRRYLAGGPTVPPQAPRSPEDRLPAQSPLVETATLRAHSTSQSAPSEGGDYSATESLQPPQPPPALRRPVFSLTDVVLDDLPVPKRAHTLPPIQLMKLSQRSDYLDWKTDVRLNFTMNSLGSMTFGSERFDEARAGSDLQYLSTWVERSRKAFTTLALSLSVQLRRTLDVERFEPCMDAPSQLWAEIRAHFEQGNGVNPTYLKAQMYNRRLQTSETVDKYVQDMERRRRVLLDNGGAMEDWELADLLLSNSLLVFPQLAMDHTLWLGEHDPRELSLPAAVQKLGTAEQSHQQLRQQGSASAGDGSRGLPARQVHGVSMHDQGKNRSSKKRKKNDKVQAPRKTIEQQKAESTCANCKATGHWYGDPECPMPMTAEQAAARAKRDKKRRAVQNVRSFAGAALVNDQLGQTVADSTEEKAATPIVGSAAASVTSTPTLGPLPVGGLETVTATSAARPVCERPVELVQETQRAMSGVSQPEVSAAAPGEGSSTATVTLQQTAGSVCAVQSEEVVSRAEVVSAVGLSLVDMYSASHPGWETMTTAMVEKVFGKVAVKAIEDYRKNADGPWSPTSPPSSPVQMREPSQINALRRDDQRLPAAGAALRDEQEPSRFSGDAFRGSPYGYGYQRSFADDRHGRREMDYPNYENRGRYEREWDTSTRARYHDNYGYGYRSAFAVGCFATAADVPADELEWILDSGSQVNICVDLALFVDFLEAANLPQLLFANGSRETPSVHGSVLFRSMNHATGCIEDRLLDEVIYSEKSPVNILSQGYMQENGFALSYSGPGQCIAWLTKGDTTLRFDRVDKIYRLRMKKPDCCRVMAVADAKATENPMKLLHNRLGHLNMHAIKQMVNKGVDFGVKINATKLNFYDCVACYSAKSRRMTYARDPERVTEPLAKLSMDVCTVNEETVDSKTMFLFVVDEYTRYKWVFLLSQKSEAAALVKMLVLQLNTRFAKKQMKVVLLHSDQGGEFLSNELHEFCVRNGIEQSTTNSYSPQENAIVERANGTVLPRIRAALEATGLPNLLWGEALLHVVDTLNKLPTKPLGTISPHELFYGSSPKLAELRTWGCLVQMHIPAESRTRKEKLSPRAAMGLLLGYSVETKGYKVIELQEGKINTHRREHIKFHEGYSVDGMYVENLLLNAFRDGMHELPNTIPVVRIRMGVDSLVTRQEETRVETGRKYLELVLPPEQLAHVGGDKGGNVNLFPAEKKKTCATATPDESLPTDEQQPHGKSKRKRNARKRRRNSTSTVDEGFDIRAPPVPPCTLRPRRATKPNVRLRDYVVNHVRLHASKVAVPNTYKQARASPYWREWEKAMQAELRSLREHKTWKLVRRQQARGHRIITCRWVFAVKRDEQGFVKRFKARLVIHGFKQVAGVNYTETYAPVIRFETIRAAIYYALQRGWAVLQYDVKTAFLYGALHETIFMEQPQGFQMESSDYVCHLLKSLYGLKQAPNIWNRTLHEKLIAMGFERLDSDYGLYLKRVNGDVVQLLTVYVDDLLIMGLQADCETTAGQLQDSFELTTIGQVKYLLGVEILIDRPRRQVIFSQQQYIIEILKRFNMQDCNGCRTPEATAELVIKLPLKDEPLPYRELVGALQYLVSASRPDIAHAVRTLGTHLANFDHTHFAKAKRVLRYLQSTRDYGLVMDILPKLDVLVSAYTDADYANDPVDRLSVSGYITMLDGNVISYASRKQGINAQSTTEAEYVAMCEGTKDILWLVGLCAELGWKHETPQLLGDNKGSIYLSEKPGKHSKTKHIENRFHLVRHCVEDKRLVTRHVSSDDMIADCMTKPLGHVKFAKFRSAMKVLQILHKDPPAV